MTADELVKGIQTDLLKQALADLPLYWHDCRAYYPMG